jgi:hypothetical protein
MASVETFLAGHLELTLNRTKSAVDAPSRRKFLGLGFTNGARPKRRIAPQALARLESRVRALTRRTRGGSLVQIVEELSRHLIGWRGYFGLCETPSVLRGLDQWVRRRLRCIAWKQWKRGRTRFAELRRRGAGLDLAAKTAGSPHGPWRIGNSPALAIALPNASLTALGLASIESGPAARAIEPPCPDPYARWCRRGGAARLPPIPIDDVCRCWRRADHPFARAQRAGTDQSRRANPIRSSCSGGPQRLPRPRRPLVPVVRPSPIFLAKAERCAA